MSLRGSEGQSESQLQSELRHTATSIQQEHILLLQQQFFLPTIVQSCFHFIYALKFGTNMAPLRDKELIRFDLHQDSEIHCSAFSNFFLCNGTDFLNYLIGVSGHLATWLILRCKQCYLLGKSSSCGQK